MTQAKTEMRRLVFGEGLMVASLNGEKTYTVRKYREEAHNFADDELVIGEFKDGLDVVLRIIKVCKGKFSTLMRSRAQKDFGYQFDMDYFGELKRYYPDITLEDQGAVIIFEVYKINGTPAVQLNKHAKDE